MRNPFRLQHAESIETDAEFLKLFGPGVLDLLPEGATQGKTLFIRSAPGGGKTSILRLFTPSVLLTLLDHSKTEQFRDVYLKVRSIEAVNDSELLVLGILLNSRRTFPSLCDLGLSEIRATRLFLALLDARIIMKALRCALTAKHLRYPDDLSQITIDAILNDPIIPGLKLPCNGEEAHEWGEKLERDICDVIDSLLPHDGLGVPGHDCLYSLYLLDANAIKVSNNPPAQSWIVLLDDAHKLTNLQRQKLITTLIEQRSLTSVWIAERLEALSKDELLSSGSLAGRDYGEVINIESAWNSKKFSIAALEIAEKRARMASDVASGVWTFGSFAASLDSNHDFVDLESKRKEALERIRKRVSIISDRYVKYRAWYQKRDRFEGSTIEKLIEWRTLEIMIARDQRKEQLTIDIELPTEELDKREDSSARTAAELFIAQEFQFPYYYGSERISQLGSFNIEQFLKITGNLFEDSLGAALLKTTPAISQQRQEKILRDTLELRISELPKRALNGRDVQRFIDVVGKFCHDETYRPNAPYSPGVTGIAISMRDRDQLINTEIIAEDQLTRRFSEMLATALANNYFQAVLDYKVKGGQYMVLYLNRFICLKYGLPLQYGGFREKPLRTFIQWFENGYVQRDEEITL